MTQINTWPGWECVRQIGEGSFGKVYEIQRKEFGKTYSAALKVITIPQNPSEVDTARSEGMTNADITDYFHTIVEEIAREFAIMSDLKGHSNIVSYEDHIVIPHEDDIGWDILVRMELLTPLLEYETQHSVSEETVIKLGCDLCEALKICESRGIIHRDIKPENIFVNDYQNFKLGDFGIARTTEKTISNLSKKGTYTYMAPEVYLGKPYGRTVDFYSLGMVLYRFLNCNRTAFLPSEGTIRFGDREDALVRRMRGEPIPEPVNGSAGLKQTVLKALSFNPEDRYQTASEFRIALEKCMDYCDVKSVADNNVRVKTVEEDKTQGLFGDFSRTKPSSIPVSNMGYDEENNPKLKSASKEGSRPELKQKSRPEWKTSQKTSKLPVFAAVGALVVLLLVFAALKMMNTGQSNPNGAVAKETIAHTVSESKSTEKKSLDTGGVGKTVSSKENKIVYHARGRYYVIEYDDQGRIALFTSYSPAGQRRYRYKASYNEADHTIIDMRFAYDEDKATARTEYQCDENWNRLTGLHYDPKNEPEYTLEYIRDKNGVLLKKLRRDMSGKLKQTWEYDANENEIKREYYKKGKLSYWYEYELDDRGYLVYERKYDKDNSLVCSYSSEVDDKGRRTKISWYDGRGVLQYTIEYHPNLQECESAMVTYYREDGTIETQKKVTDLSELEQEDSQ